MTTSDTILTPEQLATLKHSLGVPSAKKAPSTFYRSHFVTGEGSSDHPICMSLVALGLMTRRPGNPLSGGDDIFNVTGRGEAVVRELFTRSAA